jgi:hypothetical protein
MTCLLLLWAFTAQQGDIGKFFERSGKEAIEHPGGESPASS